MADTSAQQIEKVYSRRIDEHADDITRRRPAATTSCRSKTARNASRKPQHHAVA
jgi:hypothetical protein